MNEYGAVVVLREESRITLSSTNPTWIGLGSKPGLIGDRPWTNRPSTARTQYFIVIRQTWPHYPQRSVDACHLQRALRACLFHQCIRLLAYNADTQ